MFIEKVGIENFRSIRKGEFSLEDLTAFLGRNGVGKSTVLYALSSFYDLGAIYTANDYYNHHMVDTSIRIRVTYGGLRADELAEFGSYVHDGKLVVTKVINQGGARYFGTSAQIPAFADLRGLGAVEKRKTLAEKITAGEFPGFPEPLPRKGEDVDRAMEFYETAHPELTQPIEKETQFLGPKNVGGGKLDKFTKFVLVPAVRDASSEMEKRGAIMQLLDLIVMRSISNRQDFRDFKQQFEEKARALYGKENLPELTELGRLVTQRLSRYAPGSELDIDFDELKPPTIPLPDAVVSVSEDGFKVPVRYSGHGLQRALILALLEQLSMTQAPPPPPAPASEGQPAPQTPNRLPDLILAVEEPELYLHPARSRYLAKILRSLAKRDPEQPEAPLVQVLYVTHSPYFIEVEHLDQVRMCRKVASEDGLPKSTVFTSYTRLQAAQRLAVLTGRPPADFTARSFVTRAAPVLNSIVNEGLFADVAVVVEGESDVAALWAMQAKMDKKWDEKGVVVVPVGGKNNVDRAVVAFQGFNVPTYFVFDGDKSKKEGSAANRILLNIGGEPATDFPNSMVRASFAVFEENIEKYLESRCGDQFLALRDACASTCGHGEPSKALKNSEVMASFLSEAEAKGFSFPMLREIVDCVAALVPATV